MPDRDEIDRLQSEVEELFADLWQVPRFSGVRPGFRPQVDCYRCDDPLELTVVVELAGIDPADVQLAATPRTLVIAGERRRPARPGRHYEQMEIEYGPFHRQITLAEDVDVAQARASYDGGLLTITLPIARKPPEPVKVPIEVERTP